MSEFDNGLSAAEAIRKAWADAIGEVVAAQNSADQTTGGGGE